MSGVNPFRVRNGHIQLDADGAGTGFVGLELGVEVAAEAANVIEVGINVNDAAGEPVSQVWTGIVRLYDGDMDGPNPASQFEIDATTGTAITAGTKNAMIITSNADGDIAVDVTDVAGASGSTIYLVAEVISGVHAASIYTPVTFD